MAVESVTQRWKIEAGTPDYEGVARLFISWHPSIQPVILLPSSSQSYAGRCRKGPQSLLLYQYVSFQIYCQFFQACLTPSSIWPNHLVLDHSTGFFLLSFNSKTHYHCSNYATWWKACSRSSSNSINKLRILTLLKISFLPAVLLYFGVTSCTLGEA